jgi:hypothetical protein
VPRGRIELPTRGFSETDEQVASDVPQGNFPGSDTRDDATDHVGPPLGPPSAEEFREGGPEIREGGPTENDPVELALGRAIALASEAGEWTAVVELGRELAARRRARTAPDVPSIEAARAKREGKG